MINNYKTKFIKYLKLNNKKLTLERQEILDAIIIIAKATNFKKHFNSNDIFEQIQKMDSPLSLATIYRALPILADAGVIAEVAKRSGKMIYELVTKEKHHDHLLCCNCGNVIEFYSEEIEALQKQICKDLNFNIREHFHCIKGICEKCENLNN